MTPDVLARETIRAQLKRECKGKLCKIDKSHVEREMEQRTKASAESEEITPSK